MSVINNRSFGRFWSVWCTITHRFGVLERFTRFAIPGVRLCVGYQHSPFCPILVRLVDYYSPFWGPRAISTIHDPGGAFTCPSSTLIVLANSDPFRGLSLTFWGPEAISIVVEPKDALTCRSSTLAVLADSGPFCGLLLVVSGPGGISTIDEPLVRLCFGHQQSRFLSILSLSWSITHRFGVLKRFPLLSNPKVCLRVGRQVSQFWPILASFLDYYSVLGSRSDFHD